MSQTSQRKRHLYAANSWYDLYVEINLSVGIKVKRKLQEKRLCRENNQ